MNLRERLENFFFAPSDGRVLSALRIVVGGALLVKAIWILPFIENLFGQHGYLQANLMDALMGENLTSWMARQGVSEEHYNLMLYGCFYLQAISALLFAIGYRTKFPGIVLWLTQTMSFYLGWNSSYGVDTYLHNLTFLMLWLPVDRHYSVERALGRVEVQKTALCTLGWRALQIYLTATYIDAGFSKAMGVDWWSGAATWKTLNTPYWNHFDFHWMAQVPWLAKVLSIGTIILEGFYIVGAWLPKIGKFWVLGIVAMHLGIAVVMGLYLFGTVLALLSATLFLFPPGEFDPVEKRLMQA